MDSTSKTNRGKQLEKSASGTNRNDTKCATTNKSAFAKQINGGNLLERKIKSEPPTGAGNQTTNSAQVQSCDETTDMSMCYDISHPVSYPHMQFKNAVHVNNAKKVYIQSQVALNKYVSRKKETSQPPTSCIPSSSDIQQHRKKL